MGRGGMKQYPKSPRIFKKISQNLFIKFKPHHYEMEAAGGRGG